jgi:putative SOS response-associated peptidase YedK
MCGRFKRKSDKKKVVKAFEVTAEIEEADFTPDDDLRPQSLQPVIYLDADGKRRVDKKMPEGEKKTTRPTRIAETR